MERPRPEDDSGSDRAAARDPQCEKCGPLGFRNLQFFQFVESPCELLVAIARRIIREFEPAALGYKAEHGPEGRSQALLNLIVLFVASSPSVTIHEFFDERIDPGRELGINVDFGQCQVVFDRMNLVIELPDFKYIADPGLHPAHGTRNQYFQISRGFYPEYRRTRLRRDEFNRAGWMRSSPENPSRVVFHSAEASAS